MHQCERIWRRARALDWTLVAKSVAKATVKPGAAELACENKPELTQAQTVPVIKPLATRFAPWEN